MDGPRVIQSDMDAFPNPEASERTSAETMQLTDRERQPETCGSSLEAALVQRIEQALDNAVEKSDL